MTVEVIHIRNTDPQGENQYYVARGKPRVDYMIGTHLGNPFSSGSKEENIARYHAWLHRKLHTKDNVYYDEITALQRKYKDREHIKLVCFCKPHSCHGDVIKKYIETDKAEWKHLEPEGTDIAEQVFNEKSFDIDEITKDNMYPINRALALFFAKPKNKDMKVHKHLFAKIMDILAKHSYVYFHNLVEMICKEPDNEDEITKTIQLLDFGSLNGLWEYVQITYDNDDGDKESNIKVKALVKYEPRARLAFDKACYHLPMIVQPEPVGKYNRGSGYILKNRDSLLLGGRYYPDDICSDFLNILNRQEMEVNSNIVEFFENAINIEELKQKFKAGTASFWETLASAEKNWRKFNKQTKEFTKMLQGKTLYFTHKYDARGRCYTQGYHFNPQGNSFCKAAIELKNKSVITDEIICF